MTDLSLWQLAVLAAAVAVGALVQGSVGFGFALVAAPVFSLIAPGAVPAAPLLLAIPLNVLIAWRERRAIDLRGFARTGIGLVVGTVVGAVVVAAMPSASLTVAFGFAILLAVAVTAAFPTFEPGPRAHLGAGVVSGAINTVAATGGPPLALVHHHLPGARLRASLALAFLISNALSLLAVVPAGRMALPHIAIAVVMVPALIAGFAASHLAARWLDRGWLRPLVLVFAGLSGLAAIVKGLL